MPTIRLRSGSMPDNDSSFHTVEVADVPCEKGCLQMVTVKSTNLQGRGDVTLFTPEANGDAGSLPVVILLHGVYCSHWGWAFKADAHVSLQDMIDSREVPPMILAMPSDGLWGDGSGYFKHNGRDFENWIVSDIPQLVHEVTGNAKDAPHFIGGLSMGGFGALCLGARHPDRFVAFSAHSSVTRFADLVPHLQESWDDYGIDPLQSRSVIDEIMANRDRIGHFRFDCGTEDFLIEHNRRLAHDLESAGIPFEYAEFPGAHDWPYWKEHVRKTFRFFGDRG